MSTVNIATVSKAENLENFDIIGEVNGEVKSLPYSQLNEQINNLQNQLNQMWKNIYPVGAIYISVNSTSPGTLFGGTWERIQDRFLLCAGSSYSAGSTGGSATHTLTVNEMPAHGHEFMRQQWFSADSIYSTSTGSIYSWKTTEGGSTSASYVGGVDPTGSGQAHNNMPPYLSVYVWKRIE